MGSLFRHKLVKTLSAGNSVGGTSRGQTLRQMFTQVAEGTTPAIQELGRAAAQNGGAANSFWVAPTADFDGHLVRAYTGGSVGTAFGWQNPGDSSEEDIQTRSKGLFTFIMRCGGTITDSRFIVGLASGNAGTSDDPALHGVWLRGSVGDDTNWQVCSKDGSTISVTDSGIPITAARLYVFEVDITNNASIPVTLIGADNARTLLATKTANLPGVTTGLFMQMTVTPKASATKEIQVCKMEGWVG